VAHKNYGDEREGEKKLRRKEGRDNEWFVLVSAVIVIIVYCYKFEFKAKGRKVGRELCG
jgi:hypothetical protein